MDRYEKLESFAAKIESGLNDLRDAHDIGIKIFADFDNETKMDRKRFLEAILTDIRRFDTAIDANFLENPCGFKPEEE